MEFLDGETLADRLRKGPLTTEQVLKYGIEICERLERAHKSGVVHRDLKPAKSSGQHSPSGRRSRQWRTKKGGSPASCPFHYSQYVVTSQSEP
jgi:serine/threonine protein kinase